MQFAENRVNEAAGNGTAKVAFAERVYSICRRIPRGRVSTYKEIARALGTKAYRAVGHALRCNPYAPIVPCHRVVSSDGSIGGFKGQKTGAAIKEKIALLSKEGIRTDGSRILEFEKVLFRF